MYQHTQKSPLNLLLYLPAIFLFFVAWQIRENAPPSVTVAIIAIVLIVLALSFQSLTIRDDEDALDIRYGPLNFFGLRIPYDQITHAQPSNSSLIDGWGIHFIPLRGWTVNLWGFECVLISRKDKKDIRIGTDDSENLVAFLQSRSRTIDTATEPKQ
ncbi:MAG: hypothetical protein AAFN77_13615 [Planctomycetota bacterium]